MTVAPSKFPGERLGLPESGRGSIARFGRRFVGLMIDWFSAVLVVMLVSRTDYLSLAANPAGQFTILGVFAALQILGLWTMSGSLGHRIMGLQLVSVAGTRGWLWRPVVRSVLLALVIPALVWDSDQRGFHDKIAGTALLKTR